MPAAHRQRNRVLRQDGQGAGDQRLEKPAQKDIDWSKWWPFDRATGDALIQLNKKQPPVNFLEEFEDAPL